MGHYVIPETVTRESINPFAYRKGKFGFKERRKGFTERGLPK